MLPIRVQCCNHPKLSAANAFDFRAQFLRMSSFQETAPNVAPTPLSPASTVISSGDSHVTVIRPRRGSVTLQDFRDLWQYRDLLLTLGQRDVMLRYRQTALGVAWVVLQPLLASAVFSIVFGLIARVPTGGVPQFLISYVGMLGWNVFGGTLSKVSLSMIGNANLVSKIYFPRLVLPMSTINGVLVDFAVGLVVLVPLLFLFHVPLHAGLLLMPVFLLILLLLALGAGLSAAALTVSYRDIQYVVPFFIQLLMYGSPVHYSAKVALERLPRWAEPVFSANPLVGVLEGFHWSLNGGPPPGAGQVSYSAVFAIVLLGLGMHTFKRMERTFADVI